MYTGQYGDPNVIGLGNSILIILQLSVSGLIIMLLDEMSNKVARVFRDSESPAPSTCLLPPTSVRTSSGAPFLL